ncbi:DUF5403 family protein [Corynebacterium sp. S7]
MADVFDFANAVAAELAQDEMDRVAEEMRAQAESTAAEHRDSGEFSGNFKVKKQGKDRYVYNDHPAAWHIEGGHFARGKDGRPGDWVPGQFNLTRASRKDY